MYHVLLGALYVYFTRTAQRDDLTIGLPVLNRKSAKFKQTAGLFTGVSAVSFNFGKDLSFAQLLQQINQTLKANYRHQRLPVSEINRTLGLKSSRSQLFDISLSYEKFDHQASFAGVSSQSISVLHHYEQTPLMIFVRDFDAQRDVECNFVFNFAYFNADEIKAFQARFVNILQAVLTQEQEPLLHLPIMTQDEIQQLQNWNQTQTDYPKDKTIVDLFEQQVEMNPNNIAVVFKDQKISYQALNQQANQLAHLLIKQGVQADTLVGLCIERSVEMIIALLGILKAGAAYVPLDANFPQERLDFMLEDSQVPVLLTQSHLQEKFPASSAKVICLDDEAVFTHQRVTYLSNCNPVRRSAADDLAYVIYTSGSTGKPKGVMNTHQALANFIHDMQEKIHLQPQNRLLALTTISFDIAALELYLPLSNGATIDLISRNVAMDPQQLKAKLSQGNIDVMQATPATWQMLLDSGWQQHHPLIILCGGEAMSAELGQRLFVNCQQLWNVYGPTETTIWSTAYNLSQRLSQKMSENPVRNHLKNALIGQPIANTQIYILDSHQQPQPVGISGELCIAGMGLARGYLNRPELTTEKFIEINLFGKNKRVYKTGDLACWLPDGNLEYLGRIDHQVKLRGFRIELGEIEATLNLHHAISEAVVCLYEGDNNKRLVAYVIETQLTEIQQAKIESKTQEITDNKLKIAELGDWLKGQLPDYMVPASFTVLDKLPLTPNGKVDRKALPAPQVSTNDANDSGKPINTDCERLLASLWSGVLNLEINNTRAHFFELGGHSILATQLISRIRDSFTLDMPLSVLFEHPILSEMAHWLGQQQQQQQSIALPDIIAQPRTTPLQLSYAQQRLWFLAQLEGASATYNMPMALKLVGKLDIPALRQTFVTLIERHQILRQSFSQIDGEASVQNIDVYDPLTITALPTIKSQETTQLDTQQADINIIIDRHAKHSFDLSVGKLLQLELLLLDEDEHILLLNIHHIISDGWSMSLLAREWGEIYKIYAQEQEPVIQSLSNHPLAIQYSDYAIWQRQWLQGDVLQQQLDYWIQHLNGTPDLLELPSDAPRPAVQSYQGAHLQTRISSVLSKQLKTLSQQHNCTLFMTLLSSFNVLLHRCSGQDDIVVGCPVANRSHSKTEDLIGMFVNTLVMRTRFDKHTSFTELLQQTRQTALNGYAHQEIPFEHLIEQLNPQRSLSYSPLFQVMFVLQNIPESTLELPSLDIQVIKQETHVAKFDLTLSINDIGEHLELTWEYATDLFRAERIQRMAEHFTIMLEAICQNPEVDIHQLPLLTRDEKLQLQNWNQTQSNYPKDKTIVDLFEQQVEINPGNIAVVFENKELSYQALNQQANQLAHLLIKQGVQADTLVGICIERSVEMLIGLLGILKAGAAYVPLDPHYPQDRLNFMLEDSQVSILLTQSHLTEKLLASFAQVICLDEQTLCAHQHLTYLSNSNPERRSGFEYLAYVIYTSGSTGKPKGVMITHQALSNLLHNMQNKIRLKAKNHLLALTTLSFDIAALELYLPLSNGACIDLISREVAMDPQQLKAKLSLGNIDVMQATPATWQILLDSGWQQIQPLNIICCGEAMSSDLGQRLSANSQKLWNGYGPSETTIFSTVYDLSQKKSTKVQRSEPIGQPIANTQIYILDAHQQLQPVSSPGELCIAGAGLARGYLNRPELTAEKFIAINVFGEQQRVYKTGDLARWLPDGNLEYLGRIDHQVKLRGFRIELGEIEAVLSQHPSISEAVVSLYEDDNNKRLVAYVTEIQGKAKDKAQNTKHKKTKQNKINAIELANWLKSQLPDYMVPASFTVLDKLPLTPNGKIDRKALPAPQPPTGNSANSSDKLITTDSEQLLATLWSGVLNLEVNSTKAQFFELGGHSLLATQLVSRIRDSFSIYMPLSVLFEYPVLGEMAHWLGQQQRSISLPDIIAQPDSTPLQLSYAQQRLWFLAQLEGSSATYNMPAAFKITGKLDIAALKQTFITLVQRHQSLRHSFLQLDGETSVQCIDVYDPLTVTALPNTQSANINEIINRHAKHTFNLSTGKLLQLKLVVLAEHEHMLLFNMHHIISDGWSMSLLVREWADIYKAYAQEQQADLQPLPVKSLAIPPLPIQYSDYAIWQRQWLQGDILQQQLDYWTQQLKGATEFLKLPSDCPRPSVQSYQGAQLKTRITPALSRLLKTLSQKHNCTLFMTLLSAFNVLLHRYTEQNDIVVGSPIANRSHSKTEQLIGMFVNTLVMRTRFEKNMKFTELMKQTRKTALDGYAYQDIPFEHLIEQLNPQRSLSYSPLFQVMFVLQNTPENELELPNLHIEHIEQDTPIAKFDLTLFVNEVEEHLELTWEYATDLFRAERIQRMAEHFTIVLDAICQNPEVSIHQLPMLTTAEAQQLQNWNQTQTEYPKDKTIVDLFEQQVEINPDNIAVVFEDQALSYQALNQQTNQLAHCLIEQGVQADTLVGICVERSMEMIIGLLGILKAGGAYVPLDPNYPQERLDFMLEDSQLSVLLTQSHLTQNLSRSSAKLVCINDFTVFKQQPSSNPESRSDSNNLAYVLFTSGSTGRPKGVMLDHSNALNLVLWAVNSHKPEHFKGMLASTSINFDVSVYEIFATLCSAGQLILVKNILSLDSSFHKNKVTMINTVPAAMAELMASNALPDSVKVINLAGETLKNALVQTLYQQSRVKAVYNHYGPTEDSYTSGGLMEAGTEQITNIGQPAANTQIFILNSNQQLQPIGVPGELYTCGAGVARGYLNRPELTAEKFIDIEIFGKTQRVYKTGDLARWLPDGNLEFIGRIDNQVKLRGFRIELGEIEAVLNQHPAINEAVVSLYEGDGNIRLIAYVTEKTSCTEESVEVIELLNWLKSQLPDYMLPASFTLLDKLPLSPNGKIDRKALPAPMGTTNHNSYTPPRNALELQLLQLWQTLLGLKSLSIYDNFFEVGGHSLLALKLISHIRQQFSVVLPVSILFKSPTVAQLCQHLQQEMQQGTARSWSDCVPIHNQGKGTPIFLLPGAMGSVLYLQPLAGELGKEQPLYALQTPGFNSGQSTPDSVEALASYHLNAIRKQQPQGPYRLLGHSSGGRVAFEIALQLEKQGEIVDFLGMLDTRAPNPEQVISEPDTDEYSLWSLVMIFKAISGLNLELTIEELEALKDSEAAYAATLKVFQQHQLLFTTESSVDDLKRWFKVYRATLNGYYRYQSTGKLCCPIQLFLANEHVAILEKEQFTVESRPAWGWNNYTQAQVEEVNVPGNHVTMMVTPQVKTLAKAIRAKLDVQGLVKITI